MGLQGISGKVVSKIIFMPKTEDFNLLILFRELLDHQGNEETLVNQDLRETEDHLVLLDFREHPVIRENLALKVLPD